MPEDRDFERRLRTALHAEADAQPQRVDPAAIRERMTRRNRVPGWLLPVALPVGTMLLVAAVVVNVFPGPTTAPGSAVSSPKAGGSPVAGGPAASPSPRPTPHPANRTESAVAQGEDLLYVIGGRRGATELETAVVFDGRTWTDLPPLPTDLVGSAAVTTEDRRVFVFGGETASGPTGAVDSTYVLEPGADAWVSGPPLPFANASMAAAAIDGRVYLVGGSAEGHERDVVILDLETDEWSDGAQLPVPLEDPTAVAVGTELYVVSSRIALRHETTGGTWDLIAEPPLIGRPRAVLAASGKVWLVGGTEGPHERYPGVAAFDPGTGSWTRTDVRLPPGNTWLLAYRSGDRLFVIGGHEDGITNSVVDMAQP